MADHYSRPTHIFHGNLTLGKPWSQLKTLKNSSDAIEMFYGHQTKYSFIFILTGSMRIIAKH